MKTTALERVVLPLWLASDFVPTPASFGRDKVQAAEIRNPGVRVPPAEDTAVFMYVLDVKSQLADEREPGTDAWFKRNNE